MLYRIAPTKTFYVGGMNTSDEEAQRSAWQLAKIFGGCVHLHYNRVSPPSRIRETALKGLVFPPYIPFRMGQIQAQKQNSADHLACKIAHHLRCNPGRVALFGHSQGADIVRRTRDLLCPAFRDRVDITTIGGMTPVWGAVNFVNDSDLIAKGAQLWTWWIGQSDNYPTTQIASQVCSTILCHGAEDYMNHWEFIRRAQEVTAPTLVPV